MIKQCFFILTGICLAVSAHALQVMQLKQGYTFEPGQTITMRNGLSYRIKFDCNLHTLGTNDLELAVQQKSITIDDRVIYEGQTHVQSIVDDMTMKLGVEGYALVKITNLGTEAIHVDCKLSKGVTE